MNKKLLKIIMVVLIIIVIFLFDQVSKITIDTNYALGESKEIIKNFFSLTYVRNTGAAFSILSGKVNLILLVSFFILFYLIYEMVLYFKYTDLIFLLSFLIGGMLGNLYDRLFLGYVRDFFDFNILGYNFPIFNISDIFVVISAIFIVLLFIFKGDYHENKSK